MKRLIALMLCLLMALCILPAQAVTLAGPFTFDLDTFQSYYPMLLQKDVAWTQQGDCVVGSTEDLPDVQLYMNEAGQVEYMLVQISCPISEAGTATGEEFGTVLSSAVLSVMLCEVTDPDAVNAGVETFLVELNDVIDVLNQIDSAKDEEIKAGLTSYGPLANHEGCVGVQVSEDGTMNIIFMFAPDGTQFE